MLSKRLFISFISCTASSPASVGVAARLSATKSAIEKSLSCPTAEITGILHLKMASATLSSLKAHKSSIEPPPLVNISVSTPNSSNSSMALIISPGASFPWTIVGLIRTFIPGKRFFIIFRTSLTAAPSAEVIIPILSGKWGIGFLFFSSKNPFFSNFSLIS
jgi:hypothetical protein